MLNPARIDTFATTIRFAEAPPSTALVMKGLTLVFLFRQTDTGGQLAGQRKGGGQQVGGNWEEFSCQ